MAWTHINNRISLTLVLLIFVGEAVRDAFDPKKTFSD